MSELFYSCFYWIFNEIKEVYDKLAKLYDDNMTAEIIIAIVALWFAFKEWNSKRGHNLEVMYSILSSSYHQPQISDLWIYNKKNKIEVITEINVLFGANCVLQLKEFDNNAFILNPNEMKKVDLDPISIYAMNCRPINMTTIFNNHKIKKTFFLTTPEGRIKAKNLKQIPHDTFIKDILNNAAFGYIYHRQYPAENRVLDFKIKYFGYCVFSEQLKCPFYVYQDGIIRTEGLKKDFLKIDLEEYNTIEKIKKFLLGAKLAKQKYIVEIYQRSPFIDKIYAPLEEKDISSMIYSNWQYLFIEPLARWYKWRGKKKNASKRKKKANETKV